jgi:hypothetical protein
LRNGDPAQLAERHNEAARQLLVRAGLA